MFALHALKWLILSSCLVSGQENRTFSNSVLSINKGMLFKYLAIHSNLKMEFF